MSFKNMIKMTKLKITDKEGKSYESEGQIQKDMIYIYDNIPIDSGYDITYQLSNGILKNVVVIEPGYYGDTVVRGDFPIYQCKVKDKNEYEKINNNKTSNINVTNQNGAVIIGNVLNSHISITNTFSELEKKISEDGSTDKAELQDLLEQVKELCATMEEAKCLPKNKSLMKKISTHMTKHSWFYSEIVQIIGATVIKIIENN